MADLENSSGARELVGSGALYTLATVAPVLVALLITPAVTRTLGAEGYGVVGISTTLYQFGAIVLGFGLSASITRHAIIADSGVPGAVSMVHASIVLSAFAAVAAIASLPLWGPAVLGGQQNEWALAWPVISSAALSVLTCCQSVFRAISRVKTFVVLGMLAAIAGPAFGFGLLLTLGPVPGAYLAGLAAGHVLAAGAALLLLPRSQPGSFSLRDLRENLAIGLPTVPHSVAGAFLVTALVIMASRTDGVAAAGQLQLALFLGTSPLLVLGAFNNSWAPAVYRTADGARPAYLARSMRIVAVLVFVLVGGFCTLIDPVARFIAGPALFTPDLVHTALIACTATAFMALYLVNIHLVFLSGRTTLLAATSPVSLLMAVTIAIVIRAFGWNEITAFALGIPLFHLSQWLMSGWLRRRTGYPAPHIGGALPALLAAIALPVLAIVMGLGLVPLACMTIVGAAGFIGLERLWRRAVSPGHGT